MPELTISLPTFAAEDPGSWQLLLDRAIAADAAGIDRVIASEHVVYGENLEAYAKPELGGSAGASQPTGPDGHWLDSLTVLSFVAAQTSRVRVATNILQAALRTPATLAKQLATMDVLSNGRVDLGVGVGWQREEYDACGLDFDTRGQRLDVVLEVMQKLWREPVASHASPELTFDKIHMQPKPRQAGGIPIWVSGTINKRVVQRLGRFGTGWILWGPAAADPIKAVADMKHALTDAGFDASTLKVAGNVKVVRQDDGRMDIAATMGNVAPMAEAGITDSRAAFATPAGQDEATEYYAEVVAAFRKVTA